MCRLTLLQVKETRTRLRSETLIAAAEAAIILTAREEIVIRWIARGRAGKKLEGFFNKADGQWFTSREACHRFERSS